MAFALAFYPYASTSVEETGLFLAYGAGSLRGPSLCKTGEFAAVWLVDLQRRARGLTGSYRAGAFTSALRPIHSAEPPGQAVPSSGLR